MTFSTRNTETPAKIHLHQGFLDRGPAPAALRAIPSGSLVDRRLESLGPKLGNLEPELARAHLLLALVAGRAYVALGRRALVTARPTNPSTRASSGTFSVSSTDLRMILPGWS